jgi:hypothetical protein
VESVRVVVSICVNAMGQKIGFQRNCIGYSIVCKKNHGRSGSRHGTMSGPCFTKMKASHSLKINQHISIDSRFGITRACKLAVYNENHLENRYCMLTAQQERAYTAGTTTDATRGINFGKMGVLIHFSKQTL